MHDVLHISSLLVRSIPERMPEVLDHIATVEGAEVALTDPEGKIVITMETPSESHIVDALTNLQLIDCVVSAALIYHQTDNQTTKGAKASGQPAGDMT